MTNDLALARLAYWLREQRARSGRTYRELATRTKCTATTLQRAASGKLVPTRTTVLSYARACDGSSETALMLWKAARHEAALEGRRRRPAPRPEAIWDEPELIEALVDLYRRAGSPSLRLMEERAGGYGVLPRSTAHRIVNRQLVPRSRSQFVGYLMACEVSEAMWDAWTTAWGRTLRSKVDGQYGHLVGGPHYRLDESLSPWFETVSPSSDRFARTAARGKAELERAGWFAPVRDSEYVEPEL
ncbi:helix-turn-helix domain-containing protein [Streptomyces sp. NPDC056191]|uniref:helix-turn-helix domain-containing protein n=1 Tax=Streptomyces sp. NPDC056191 TaxID=3345742 RepID=UPI0035E2E898